VTFVNAVLLYLLLFRVAIIGAAVVSVVLGYKLFCRGIGIGAGAGSGSSIESSMVGAKLSVKNAAPGTAFALFGAILIVVMLIQSSPSVTWESMSKWRPSSEEQGSLVGEESNKIVMRGDAQDSIHALTALGIEYEKKGDVANAERSYREAVTIMAEPINDLAWQYLRSGRSKEAVGMATLAVQLRPDEPRYRDTLNKVNAAAK
jgi:hypothetical protein